MDIKQLESTLAAGTDTALLRFTLGSAYAGGKQYAQAIPHLARAVELDPDYSAAWKLYGRTLFEAGDLEKASQVLEQGLAIARQRGDMQAAREMQAWQRKLKR